MSADAVRHYLGHIHRALKLIAPHGTWILGLVLVVDGFYELGWTQFLAEHPRMALGWIGVVLLLSGRGEVRYRKKWRKAKRRATRYKEDYEEVLDHYVGQSI